MKKNEEKKPKVHHDKGQIFVKVTAGVLAILMIVGMSGTLLYALFI